MIRIVADSPASLPADVVRELGIEVVPLYVVFGEESYRDGVDLTNDEFYARLETAPCLPTTSQPSLEDFRAVYAPLVARGDQVVSIHVASALSGTVGVARQAARAFPAGAITVVDTSWVSLALGFQVCAAARVARRGGTVDDVVAAARDLDGRLRLLFALDTLEGLQRGGRISRAAFLAAGLLQVKPILRLNRGVAEVVGRPRARRASIQRLAEIVAADVPAGAPLHVGFVHARAPEAVAELERAVRARCGVVETLRAEVGPTLGAHVGLGAVGLAYFVEA